MFTTPGLIVSVEFFFSFKSEPRCHSLSWISLCLSFNPASEFICSGSASDKVMLVVVGAPPSHIIAVS